MRNFIRLLIVAALIGAGWYHRDKLTGLRGKSSNIDEDTPAEVDAPPASSGPAPIGTPHPAREAQLTAAQLYPALKIPNSPFNKKFLALHAEARSNDPALMAQPDWPITLAERTAIALGGGVIPRPAAPAPVRPSGLQGTSLDQKKPGGH